jgi:hypothetical protein
LIFLLKYHQNPPSPQKTEHKKEEREKLLKKERKKKRKKKKSCKSLFKLRGSQFLRGEKHFNFKNIIFDVIPFSPPLSYNFKNPFQNH